MRIECPGCGHRLELPDGFPEGADLVCDHCGLWLRNVEAARSFRWAALDPFRRRHGASRWSLWGGLAGALLWIPMVAVVMVVKGQFDASFLAAVAIPYLAGVALLVRLRARTPAMLFLGYLWIGMGLYCGWLQTLLATSPDWRALTGADGDSSIVLLAEVGLLAVAAGALTVFFYRRKVAKLQRFKGTPPDP